MMRLALLCVMVSPALSQCPYTSTTSTTISPTPSSINNTGSDDISLPSYCRKVKTISRPVSVIAKEQPVLIFMTGNSTSFTRVDNMCITFFPLPGTETFKAYLSTVYKDNSSMVLTYITKSFATGVNLWAISRSLKEQIVAFGPGDGHGTGQKLTDECFRNAQKLARENGLDFLNSPGSFYLPSYNLPTRCVFKQICLPKDSPVSCQQGNSCKADTQ